MYGDERTSEAHATFNQSGKRGFGRIALADVNTATGLPSRIREAGSAGIPVFYRVDGVDVVARDRAGTAVKLTFTKSEEHTSELQSLAYLVCRLLLEKKKK